MYCSAITATLRAFPAPPAQTVLGFLATIIVMWFSRWREFRADAGGATLGSRAAMISALQTLAGKHGETSLPKAVQAFGISGAGGIARLFYEPSADRAAHRGIAQCGVMTCGAPLGA